MSLMLESHVNRIKERRQADGWHVIISPTKTVNSEVLHWCSRNLLSEWEYQAHYLGHPIGEASEVIVSWHFKDEKEATLFALMMSS